MSTTCCAYTKPTGAPCAARPLPGSDFCLFHDPAHAQAQAEARSQGGAAPRRRLRRFPRLLDHVHVAELLGELFIDALNDPEAIDTHRLQALTALSRVLLKAVGTPPTFLVHSDRREPHPAAGHLLRVYPPLPPAVEALLAAEPPADDDCQPPPPVDSPLQELDTVDAGDGAAWFRAAEFLPPAEPAAPPSAPPPLARNGSSPATATSDPSDPSDPSPPLVSSRLLPTTPSPEPLAGGGAPPGRTAVMAGPPSAAALLQRLSPAEQQVEQALNRAQTGPSRTEKYWDRLLAAISPPPSVPP